MPNYDVASHGFSAPGQPYDPSKEYGQIGASLANMVVPGGKAEAEQASARKSNAEAQLKEMEIQGYSKIGAMVGEMADNMEKNPTGAADNFRKAGLQVIRQGMTQGIPAKNVADLLLSFAGTAGFDNKTQAFMRAGAGLTPLGPDQAITEDRQNTIRSENRADDINKANISADATRDAARIRANAPEKGGKINFNQADDVDAEINAQVGGGDALDPALKTSVRAKAMDNFNGGMNPASAVQDAIGSLTVKKTSNGIGTRMGLTDPTVTYEAPSPVAATTAGLAQPPADNTGSSPAVSVAPAPATRQIGQTYTTPSGPMLWTGTGWKPVR